MGIIKTDISDLIESAVEAFSASTDFVHKIESLELDEDLKDALVIAVSTNFNDLIHKALIYDYLQKVQNIDITALIKNINVMEQDIRKAVFARYLKDHPETSGVSVRQKNVPTKTCCVDCSTEETDCG